MTEASGELLVIDKTYELVLWSCRHIAVFPRSHRFTLGERMERRLYDLLELLLKAKYSGEKAGLLRQANMELELLRFQLRLAKDLECLTLKRYKHGVCKLKTGSDMRATEILGNCDNTCSMR